VRDIFTVESECHIVLSGAVLMYTLDSTGLIRHAVPDIVHVLALVAVPTIVIYISPLLYVSR
jgi:hypothetical protein